MCTKLFVAHFCALGGLFPREEVLTFIEVSDKERRSHAIQAFFILKCSKHISTFEMFTGEASK